MVVFKGVNVEWIDREERMEEVEEEGGKEVGT